MQRTLVRPPQCQGAPLALVLLPLVRPRHGLRHLNPPRHRPRRPAHDPPPAMPVPPLVSRLLWPDSDGSLPGLPELDRRTVAGIAVAISGNLLISLALNFQKLAHRRLESEREQRSRELKQQTRPTTSAQDPFATQSTTLIPHPDASESEPLLPRQNGAHSYGSAASGKEQEPLKGRWGILSKFRRTRVVDAARKADRAHNGAVHALMPVDVITVHSTAPSERDEVEEGGNSEADEKNESNYLKSKLW